MPSVGKIAAKEVIFLCRTVVIYLFIEVREPVKKIWKFESFVPSLAIT
jgi:hypothetical protein